MALNAKLTNGPECLTVNDSSERQTKDTNLSAKLNNGSECQIKNSKCQIETNNDFERQNEDVALNAELKEIWWI